MSIAQRISQKNRARKWRLFEKLFVPTPHLRVLDVGYCDEEFSPSDNLLEKKYPYPHMIVALGIEEPVRFHAAYPEVRVRTYNGTIFPFEKGSFDVVWSNAVIEHVGNRERQIAFLQEIVRVGKAAYLTTPNRWFPFEVHTRIPFMHWILPKRWFDRFLRLVGKGWAAGDYMHLLSESELRSCLNAAGIYSYSIIRNRFLGFTLDFVIVIGKDLNTEK